MLKKTYKIFKISTKNVEHVLQAIQNIKRVNPVCGVLIPTHGLCRVNPVLVARSNRPYVLPVPTAVVQTVSIVFVLACAAWLVCRHNAGLVRSTNRPNKL